MRNTRYTAELPTRTIDVAGEYAASAAVAVAAVATFAAGATVVSFALAAVLVARPGGPFALFAAAAALLVAVHALPLLALRAAIRVERYGRHRQTTREIE